MRFFYTMANNITPTPLFVDAHEDLAWNMLTFGRDYRHSAVETRQLEAGSIAPTVNGDTMLGLAEFRQARTLLIFATLFTAPLRSKEGDWDIVTYRDSAEAHRQDLQQLDAYERLLGESPADFCHITSRGELRRHVDHFQACAASGTPAPVGLLYLMEGADGIRSPREVEEWYARGVRLIGPAWWATRYCGGTREPGPLTAEGFELLRRMEELGMVLDLSHMDEAAARQSLDVYQAPLLATHANPYTLNRQRESNRFLKDEIIHGIAERGGVIGVVPYNLFLDPAWQKDSPKNNVALAKIADQIDYICQLLGRAENVGIGTDFDGGFGLQSSPAELDSIADLPVLIPILQKRGYTESDIAGIFGLNWLNFLLNHLPE